MSGVRPTGSRGSERRMSRAEVTRAARSRRLGVAFVAAFAASCASGAALQREAESIQSQLDTAREAGAYRCAPRALAEAESNLEFLTAELSQGNAVRAKQHKELASTALVTVKQKMDACPPLISDRDGDGTPDDDDRCPDDPGPAELKGCPDRDGDGIPDIDDQCPDAPEDFDGNEDEDGCPENEDSDGDTIIDPEDNCPKVPGPVENQGCPYGDKDGDGILDKDDQCPDDPEDKDGWEDEDGCPDPDNDGDGILDKDDKCPVQPENINDYEDEDGCPDVKLKLVEVKRDIGKIEIKQKVFFDTGKATIKSRSFELLNEVASALKSAPTMTVLVEGHTDSVGSNSMNMGLSQRRADSVRSYLLEQGVEPERLTAIGFGEEKPIDTNRTKKGRERNRRVEFTITGE
ncbi:MAG: OmpA family protein [Deltaproteobacteria bacterium]